MLLKIFETVYTCSSIYSLKSRRLFCCLKLVIFPFLFETWLQTLLELEQWCTKIKMSAVFSLNSHSLYWYDQVFQISLSCAVQFVSHHLICSSWHKDKEKSLILIFVSVWFSDGVCNRCLNWKRCSEWVIFPLRGKTYFVVKDLFMLVLLSAAQFFAALFCLWGLSGACCRHVDCSKNWMSNAGEGCFHHHICL